MEILCRKDDAAPEDDAKSEDLQQNKHVRVFLAEAIAKDAFKLRVTCLYKFKMSQRTVNSVSHLFSAFSPQLEDFFYCF